MKMGNIPQTAYTDYYKDAAPEAPISAVSWAAVISGAFVAASVSLIFFAAGSGFGLAAVSPWPNMGASATAFTVAAGVWLVIVQWAASGVGGYVTGRLRTKWVGTHDHEVFFRDTAHGFLTWSVATVIGAGLAATIASASAGAHATESAAQTAASVEQGGNAMDRSYDVDSLFRSVSPSIPGSQADAKAEATRILAMGAVKGDVPPADRAYLTELVAARTGINPIDAQARVEEVIDQEKTAIAKARQAADAARKAVAAFSVCTALSLLIGAFIACTAAAIGGQQRDEHP
jgi:hypothetical protein